jgi:DNA-binding MarR family transcriptional regulator
MASTDLAERLAAALERVAAVGAAYGAKRAPAAGLSRLQARVLDRLLRRPDSRIGELARELNVTAGTLSEALSSLEAKGLVSKGEDPSEHRAVRVELTRSGRRAAEAASHWPSEWLAPALEDLDPATQGHLLGSLLELIGALERRGALARVRMCLGCRFFEAGVHRGARPHHCHLLQSPIGPLELRVDCPDFEPSAAP